MIRKEIEPLHLGFKEEDRHRVEREAKTMATDVKSNSEEQRKQTISEDCRSHSQPILSANREAGGLESIRSLKLFYIQLVHFRNQTVVSR